MLRLDLIVKNLFSMAQMSCCEVISNIWVVVKIDLWNLMVIVDGPVICIFQF